MLESLFAVEIVFLCILTNIRGEQSRVFSPNEANDWFSAKKKCTLLANERHFSSFSERLGWTNFSAKYLPWIEYLGCFEFRNMDTSYSLKKQVTKGEQLQECIVHCNSSQFFGLQKSTCLCLHSPNLPELYKYIVNTCDTNATTCLGDPFGFCGTEGGRKFLSVYQKASVNIDDRHIIGNCLEFDNRYSGRFNVKKCSTELFPICYDDQNIFNKGKETKSNWKDAFHNCQQGHLANYDTVKSNVISHTLSAKFWLSNIRRWTRMIDEGGYPTFCVAARIKQNGDVERSIHRCRDHLPALCVTGLKTSTDVHVPAKQSSTLSLVTTFSSKIENTSTTLQSQTFQSQTISSYSVSLRSTFSSQFVSTTPVLNKTTARSTVVDQRSTFSSQVAMKISTGRSKVVDRQSIFSFQIVSTPAMKIHTGRSKVVQETTSSSPYLKETTYPVLVESTSPDLPGKDGVSVILIIAIVAATILIVIVILVSIVVCRRKKNTQVLISNESLAMVGKEVMYAQVNKPTVKREKSTSSQKSQPAASDDTYDHMDHRQLRETHNPTESNYDTMRSIANAGEEENNYDHVTGTKNEPKRFVVDGALNYSHIELECHEVKEI